MWYRIRQWWAAQGALASLQGVSDRMLDDMGLERSNLRARVLGRADMSPTEATGGTGIVPSALAAPCRC